jgi:uncharacterized protein
VGCREGPTNQRKHGISFDEAASVFHDPRSSTIADPLHSEEEDRFVILGESIKRRILVVVHVEREDTIRIISARLATPAERKTHEEGEEA